jgi:hypothetical protein
MPITLRRTLPAEGSNAMGPGEREPQPSRAGSNTHIGMVDFAEVASVQLVHVPSRSSGALTPLLRSDDIKAAMSGTRAMLPVVKEKRPDARPSRHPSGSRSYLTCRLYPNAIQASSDAVVRPDCPGRHSVGRPCPRWVT